MQNKLFMKGYSILVLITMYRSYIPKIIRLLEFQELKNKRIYKLQNNKHVYFNPDNVIYILLVMRSIAAAERHMSSVCLVSSIIYLNYFTCYTH